MLLYERVIVKIIHMTTATTETYTDTHFARQNFYIKTKQNLVHEKVKHFLKKKKEKGNTTRKNYILFFDVTINYNIKYFCDFFVYQKLFDHTHTHTLTHHILICDC